LDGSSPVTDAAIPDGETPLFGIVTAESALRLRTFVDAYGLEADDRAALAPMLGRRARAMYDMLRDAAAVGRDPWAGSTGPTGRTGGRPPSTSRRTSMRGMLPCAKLSDMTTAYAARRDEMMPRFRGR
jgi:hypothetical protein